MSAPGAPHAQTGKAVVVHAGARDAYQLALALSDVGLLQAFVTDLFWPSDRSWANAVARYLPPGLHQLLQRRSAPGLPFKLVRLRLLEGLRVLLLDKAPRVPLEIRRSSTRALDASLGRTAGRLARRTRAGLISYSYTGFDAMEAYQAPAMLFQVHPHPATVRRILQEELSAHPDCAASLMQEWELALLEDDFRHLVEEPRMAAHILVASSFTRNSLVEHGVLPQRITVVPYGVDTERFKPAPSALGKSESDDLLRLLFVGRINQRKGVKYLLGALRLLGPNLVHVTVCGRVVDDLSLFGPFRDQINIRPSVSEEDLVCAYQQADLFVFPSVAEGFAQVLLESLACGLPILTTTHTAGPDLITDGIEGFIVEPRRPDLLAERIAWAAAHRSELAAMSLAARTCAERFTWAEFRRKAADAVRLFLDDSPVP